MTTPVGSIRLDLTIDGTSLPKDILRSVAEAIKPTLLELNRELQKLQRELDKTARETEKSAAKQVVAEKGLEDAIERVGREQERTAAKTAAGAGLSTRSINSVTRALDKQTAAWTRLAAAQTAAAAAPQPSGPPRGGGGGGGGGGRGGGGGGVFGDLFTGQGGGSRFLTSPVGLNALALGASGLPAVTTAVVNLVGAVQALSQAGLVLPGVFAGIGTSFGVAKLGFVGMSDAIEALNEAAKSGDPKDLKKATEALKDMDPAAVATAKAVSQFLSGPWKDLQKSTAGKIFDGVDKTFTDLADKTMPTLARGTAEVGSAWNKTFKELGRVGGLDSTQSFLDKIFGNTAEAQTRANAAINPLIHGLGTLTAEGTDFLPRLADGVTALTTRLDNAITKAAGNGTLDRLINGGFDAASNLGEALLNVLKIVNDITTAAGGDGGFLKWLRDATGALHTFLSSDAGQEKLTAFFTEGKAKLDEWLPVLGNIGQIALQVFQGFQQWGDVLLPIIKSVTDALLSLGGDGGAIAGVVTAFLAWKSISGITGLLGSLGQVSTALDGIGGKASGLKGKLGGLGMLGPTAFLGGVLAQPTDGTQPPSGLAALATVGGGALTGFQVGGPWGAAIGAIIGGGTAIAQALMSQAERIEKIRLDLQHDQETQPPGTPAVVAPPPGIDQPNTAVAPPVSVEKPRAVDLPGLLVPPGLAGAQLGPFGTGTPVAPPNLATNFAPGLAEVAQAAKDATTSVQTLADGITKLPPGEVNIHDNTDEVIKQLEGLGYAVSKIPGGNLKVTVQYIDPLGFVTSGGIGHGVGLKAITPGGKADGGVLPGFSPGVDNMLWPMSGGEGVVIPEAMRALGPAWLYGINSAFRPGISRRGYADGGVLPGGLPGSPDLTEGSVVGLLTQIRDLLAGKVSGSPLVDTASAVSSIANGTAADGTTSTSGQQLGPFGTPLKKRGDPGYEMAAAAISALGGDPEKFLGTDPSLTLGGTGQPGAGGGTGLSAIAAALAGFAQSGNVSGISGLGLDANDSVVKAIAAARNKKKGGLDDDAIAGLVNQVLTGGGFTGTLDSTNTSLISALQSYREKLAKGGLAAPSGVPSVPAGAPAVGDTLATAPGLPGADVATAGAPIPVFVTNFGGGPPGIPGAPALGPDGKPLPGQVGASGTFPGSSIVQAGFGAAGGVGSDLAGDFISALSQGTDFTVPKAPAASNDSLLKERNPLALASMFGFDVPDYTRQGGAGGDLMKNDGPAFDSKGRMFNDTSSLIDRTMTDLGAQLKAQFDQTLQVFNEVKNRLSEEALKPIVQQAITAGISDISDKVTSSIGQQLGNTSAPIIAAAVKSAIPPPSSGGGDSGVGGIVSGVGGIVGGGLFDEGGYLEHRTIGLNLSGHPERVLNPTETRLFDAGLLGGWNTQPLQQHMATTSGVIGNNTVGADFFGVSQVPIIGTIVNLLVRVLLKMIGVEIEVRDTLDEMSSEVQQFRGDFQKFDATGRLTNDTSALLDRSSTSEQEAADERIRILKIVLEALVKFIIEKILIPIGKAVANAAIQAGASAAGAAINSQAPGAGGIVSSLISSAGSAGVDIGADLIGEFWAAATPVLIDTASEGLMSFFPDIMTNLFGGGLLASLFDPAGGLLGGIFDGLLGSLTGGFGGGLAGIFAALLGGLSFDEGGLAHGVGLMPKNIITPERVLSPSNTKSFDRFVDMLGRSGFPSGTSKSVTLGDIILQGTEATPEAVRGVLLAALD